VGAGRRFAVVGVLRLYPLAGAYAR